MKKQKVEMHDFYCLNCGQKSLTLPRKIGRQYKSGHRKKLYCPHCHTEVNHIECKNDFDVWEFKQAFEAGEFQEEAKESMEFIKNERDN